MTKRHVLLVATLLSVVACSSPGGPSPQDSVGELTDLSTDLGDGVTPADSWDLEAGDGTAVDVDGFDLLDVGFCGDEICDVDGGEDCTNCPDDCGPCFTPCEGYTGQDSCCSEANPCSLSGDDQCDCDGFCSWDSVDCGTSECGNGACETPAETCENCEEDCGPCIASCGDGVCQPPDEDCVNCSTDCPVCQAICGNGSCEETESCESCELDCGSCEWVCGNGVCSQVEDCHGCPEDCGECGPECGDGSYQPENQEECDDGNLQDGDGCSAGCLVEPSPADYGEILITEIMKDPDVDPDSNGEWFELYNPTYVAVNLNGWVIRDEGLDSHRIYSEDGVIIHSFGYLVLGFNADSATNGGVNVDYEYADFFLSNADDEIVLMSGDTIVDSVAYEETTFPDDPGRSMSLSYLAYNAEDNNIGWNWCSGIAPFGLQFGSPGLSNPVCEVTSMCGDNLCEGLETCGTCPQDCGFCPNICGNGLCETGETCLLCAVDCGYCCGNGTCEPQYGETYINCTQDCPDLPNCGNGVCDPEESCSTCQNDCGPCPPECGDGLCEGDENCLFCPSDCGYCCGNGTCDSSWGETEANCPEDCYVAPICGDEFCNGEEDCSTCPIDCGTCVEAHWCELSGTAGTVVDCPLRLAGANAQATLAAGLEWVMEFDGAKAHFVRFQDTLCSGTTCVEWLIPPKSTIQPSGHTLAFSEQSPGRIKSLLYHGTIPSTHINDARFVLGTLQGDALVVNVTFVLDQAISAETPEIVSLSEVIGSDAQTNPLRVVMSDDGILMTSSLEDAYCGDGNCPPSENCHICSADCGVCPQNCGDGTCNGTENCANCPGDCGECPDLCGDSACTGGETCSNCPYDCGACCGNGTCDPDYAEDCQSCAADCGACCGNGTCQASLGETCSTCPSDCGDCCGNATCDFGETCSTCPSDCGDCCGNASCDNGEDCSTCPSDCGECPPDCGDGSCGGTENCQNCPSDCGTCCGNGSCEAAFGETCSTCPSDCGDCCGNAACDYGETCETCPGDCGDCCGNFQCDYGETCETCPFDCGACNLPWCTLFGVEGALVECPLTLVRSTQAGNSASALQFEINLPSSKFSFLYFKDQLCVGETCQDWLIPPQSDLSPSGHTLSYQVVSDNVIRVIIYHGNSLSETLTEAYLSGGVVQGDPQFFSLVFQLEEGVIPSYAEQVTLSHWSAADSSVNRLSVTFDNGRIITGE